MAAQRGKTRYIGGYKARITNIMQKNAKEDSMRAFGEARLGLRM